VRGAGHCGATAPAASACVFVTHGVERETLLRGSSSLSKQTTNNVCLLAFLNPLAYVQPLLISPHHTTHKHQHSPEPRPTLQHELPEYAAGQAPSALHL